MKRTAQTILCSVVLLSFSSSAFAVLRPRYPHRAAPPYSGEWTTIGQDKKLIAPNK